MSKENIRDVIEGVCSKVLKEMNMTDEQMWEASLRLSEYLMSEQSKAELQTVKDNAKKGTPEDLEKTYHIIFLAGYHCGMADEQRKR